MAENTLTPPEEKGRDPQIDQPGVNTARNTDAKIGSREASRGVGDQQESATEAFRGTSG